MNSHALPNPLLLSLIIPVVLYSCSSDDEPVAVPAEEDPILEEIIEPTVPTAIITFPPPLSLTEGNTITVRGTASHDKEITMLRVNRVDAVTSDNYANWHADISISSGDNNINVEVGDIDLVEDNDADQALIISGDIASTIPNGNNKLMSVTSVKVDGIRNRLLVLDNIEDALITIDMDRGVRTILSGPTTPDTANAFIDPIDIVIDSANSRYLVVDLAGAIIAVDPGTGARTILSNNVVPNGVNAFISPAGAAVDSANNRLLVADFSLDAIVSVSLADGSRTILSDTGSTNAAFSFQPVSIDLDSMNNRALVLSNDDSIVAIALADGAHTLISNNTTPNTSNFFISPTELLFDGADTMYVGDTRLLSVDVNSGERTVLSDINIPNADNSLPPYSYIDLDTTNFRLYSSAGAGTIMAIDPVNGQRVIVSQ